MKCKKPNNSCHPTGWPAGRPMRVKDAVKITHTLSKPGKMPGPAYSISAKNCITGAKLAKVPGSVCAGCYALKDTCLKIRRARISCARNHYITRNGWRRWPYKLNAKNGLDGMTLETCKACSILTISFQCASSHRGPCTGCPRANLKY